MCIRDRGTLQADILIENGKIIDIAEKITAEGAEIIDAAGLLVLPGLVLSLIHILTVLLERRKAVAGRFSVSV